MQPRSYRNDPALKQAKTNENKTQVAVNEQGKTKNSANRAQSNSLEIAEVQPVLSNEATKHTKEPLKPGQPAPKNEKQQKEQTAEVQKPKRKARRCNKETATNIYNKVKEMQKSEKT